jgi:hypothetical protein
MERNAQRLVIKRLMQLQIEPLAPCV